MARRPRVVIEGGLYHVYNRVSSGEPIFGCLQSRRPLEARELTLEFEIVPEHRASLESNERNFLSL